MKKLVLAVLLVLIPGVVWAAPVSLVAKMTGPSTLAWDDPNPPAINVQGYHVFYRVVATPANPWDDTRMATVAAPTRVYSITGFNLANGNYEFAVTAFSASGESGASNIVPFVQSIPASPTNLRTQ